MLRFWAQNIIFVVFYYNEDFYVEVVLLIIRIEPAVPIVLNRPHATHYQISCPIIQVTVIAQPESRFFLRFSQDEPKEEKRRKIFMNLSNVSIPSHSASSNSSSTTEKKRLRLSCGRTSSKKNHFRKNVKIWVREKLKQRKEEWQVFCQSMVIAINHYGYWVLQSSY